MNALKFSLKYFDTTAGSLDLRSLDIPSNLLSDTPIDRLMRSPVSGRLMLLNKGIHTGKIDMDVNDDASGRWMCTP